MFIVSNKNSFYPLLGVGCLNSLDSQLMSTCERGRTYLVHVPLYIFFFLTFIIIILCTRNVQYCQMYNLMDIDIIACCVELVLGMKQNPEQQGPETGSNPSCSKL